MDHGGRFQPSWRTAAVALIYRATSPVVLANPAAASLSPRAAPLS
jgi:hypothetical protein